jgi:Uncharacterised nucleotidyltransferase
VIDETAVSLAVDGMTVEVMLALENAGIEAILLKGPAILDQLYDPGEHRPYVDCDLLIPAAAEPVVAAVLRELGFTPGSGFGVPDPGVANEHEWHRGADHLDLHGSLAGVSVPAESVWPNLAADTRWLRVAGHPVRVLGPAALALLLALHAATDGPAGEKPLEDLRRGLIRLSDAAWREATELARALDALPAFGAGLELLPEGVQRLARLGVDPGYDVAIALRARGAPPLAHSLERIHRERTLRGKLRRIARGLAPTPTYMRRWSPLAGRGRAGLALAYLWRPVWLLIQVGPGLRAWGRAMRDEAQHRC